jgi:hypothetical protein
LIRQKRTGLYHGVDFSQNLLGEAEKETQAEQIPFGLEVKFSPVDLISNNWDTLFKDTVWDGALCFAVLHHIPGSDLRQRICASIGGCRCTKALFPLAVRNSPRLMQRICPGAGADEDDLDAGDVLMDWRSGSEGDGNSQGTRYVHVFTEDELCSLAESSGFEVKESYYSDGKEGNLGLYQSWVV